MLRPILRSPNRAGGTAADQHRSPKRSELPDSPNIRPQIVCLDLEGVLMPEVWITIAEAFGISELQLTTRDIADYDELMQHRLDTLRTHDIRLSAIEGLIAELHPLPGAQEFLSELRSETQVIILSDTFTDFWRPMAPQLGYPTVFCNSLQIEGDRIIGYRLRVRDGKRRSVEAFRDLGFQTVAGGDSFNDISMLRAADVGVLFSPSEPVIRANRDLPRANAYDELLRLIRQARADTNHSPADERGQ